MFRISGHFDGNTILCSNHSKEQHAPQQYSTNENPSLSRNNFLANLMHGHSDSRWSGSSLPEITEQRIFHVLFYCEQIRLKCIINCIYPSWLNFYEYYLCIFLAKSYIVYKNMNFIHLLLSQFFTVIFHFRTSNSLQNYQNFLSWSRNVIMFSKRSKGLLA